MLPAEFAGDEEHPDGSGWLLFGELYKRNPRLLLGPAEREMLAIWRAYRGGRASLRSINPGGAAMMDAQIPGHLPDPGGVLQQSALMMRCFELMSEAEAEIGALSSGD